jgi:group I intron endonuclease
MSIQLLRGHRRSGIYSLVNTVTGRRYVGQAANLFRRSQAHVMSLRRGAHYNTYLQRAWNKYGESAFEFRIVCFCSVFQLDEQERVLLEADFPKYNLLSGPTAPPAGKPLARAHRARIGAKHRGKVMSEDARRRMREAWTEERREAQRLRQTGRPKPLSAPALAALIERNKRRAKQ